MAIIDISKSSSGGGGGGDTVNYSTQVTNKPKVNNVTLSGNKTSADLGLVGDVQINGTSIVSSGVADIPIAGTTLGTVKFGSGYGITAGSDGTIVGVVRTASYSGANDQMILTKGTLNNFKNDIVRSVAPACTTITASDTTATITANSTYAHKPTTSGLYTVVTPSDNSVYSGFIFQIDTTNSASIAFQTDGTPSATIKINGNVTPTTGKKYTITGQWDVENSSWQLFIIDYSAS